MDQHVRTLLAASIERIKDRAEQNSKQSEKAFSIRGGIMTATAQAIENLISSITEEIHVKASLDATFAALLEEIGPHSKGLTASPCR